MTRRPSALDFRTVPATLMDDQVSKMPAQMPPWPTMKPPGLASVGPAIMLEVHPTLSAASLANGLATEKKPDNTGKHPLQNHVPPSSPGVRNRPRSIDPRPGQFNTAKSGVLLRRQDRHHQTDRPIEPSHQAASRTYDLHRFLRAGRTSPLALRVAPHSAAPSRPAMCTCPRTLAAGAAIFARSRAVEALAPLHIRQGGLVLLAAMGSKDIGDDAVEVLLDGCKRRPRIRGRGDRPCQRLELGRDRLIESRLRGIPRQEQIIDCLAHFDNEVYSQFLSHDEPPRV